jgi:Cu(I)-responsive transcriptional regulator
MLTIGALAKATGTKVETIRWYEQEGILPVPARTRGNYRVYEPAHLERLGFVRRCRDLGFSLDEVRGLLALIDQPDRNCREVDLITAEHLAAVQRKIADLQRLADELRRISRRCPGGTVAECRIIEALVPDLRTGEGSDFLLSMP